MTNFEWIKMLDEKQLGEFLANYNDDAVTEEFIIKYCEDCEYNKSTGKYYCEEHDTCKLVEQGKLQEDEYRIPELLWLRQKHEEGV